MYCSREPQFPLATSPRHTPSPSFTAIVYPGVLFRTRFRFLLFAYSSGAWINCRAFPSFRKSTKPASESRGRSTTWGLKSATSKSSRCTQRCHHSSSRGSLSRHHPINQTVPSEGRYNCLVAIKTHRRGG